MAESVLGLRWCSMSGAPDQRRMVRVKNRDIEPSANRDGAGVVRHTSGAAGSDRVEERATG